MVGLGAARCFMVRRGKVILSSERFGVVRCGKVGSGRIVLGAVRYGRVW